MLFYIFHKVGHLYLYNLHKVHHEFHVPTLLATTHFHPIDYILGVLVPFAAGPKLLSNKMHIVTFMLW
jgi:sterol desaturase/sphingolipid hydroxylase (fatty acid hydroxylase superfamily)